MGNKRSIILNIILAIICFILLILLGFKQNEVSMRDMVIKAITSDNKKLKHQVVNLMKEQQK